jgi:hypothetical protein
MKQLLFELSNNSMTYCYDLNQSGVYYSKEFINKLKDNSPEFKSWCLLNIRSLTESNNYNWIVDYFNNSKDYVIVIKEDIIQESFINRVNKYLS